jgi:hypothetical protein
LPTKTSSIKCPGTAARHTESCLILPQSTYISVVCSIILWNVILALCTSVRSLMERKW